MAKITLQIFTHIDDVADQIIVFRNEKQVDTNQIKRLSRFYLVTKKFSRPLIEPNEMVEFNKESHHFSNKAAWLETDRLARRCSIKAFGMDHHAGELVGLAGGCRVRGNIILAMQADINT